MTNEEMERHTRALAAFFEASDLDPQKACAVMGNLICHLITGDLSRQSFLLTLEHMWGVTKDQKTLN